MAYDTIKIEKGLYTTGKSFTQALEELDPSENYAGTPLEGLDAYERQLKRFNIKVSGRNCDTVSKFFKTTDSAALFPEFVSRSIKLGMQDDCTVDKIIATTTYIDSLDYRSLSFVEDSQMSTFNAVNEGDKLETVEIKVSSNLTKLKKYGKIISASYEAIKFQKLDVFSLALKRIGENIMHMEFENAFEAIPEEQLGAVNIEGTDIEYSDLVNLYNAVSPFKLTTLIMNYNTYAKLLKMPEFRDANAGLDFHGTGRTITPFGAEVLCSDKLEDNIVFGLDRNYTIERVIASDVTTEFDKLIDCQLERASVSTIVGFNALYTDACKMLKKV